MLFEKSIAVVVPCFNEELLVGRVMETMPGFVDIIFVVDDKSTDRTASVVAAYTQAHPNRIQLIRHEINQGVGGAIASGYKAALAARMDVTVVMAGDAQMDPEELEPIIAPVAEGRCDYAKGNRLFSGQAWDMIPHVRYLGNAMLSLLTKVASGYWHVADSQSGYTAINLKALETIDWDKMYKNYGQPNDLLVKLNISDFRVLDVPIQPIYGIGEKSGIKPLRMIPKLSWLIFRLFLHRMVQKYIIKDFHPLVFFYFFGIILLSAGLLFGLYLVGTRVMVGPIAGTSAVFSALLTITGLQFLLFGMLFDMEANRHLK